jgi:hypothetical protein
VQWLKLPTAYRGTPMKKLIVLEALALAACIVTLVAVNPQTGQMMVAASQAVNRPQESVRGRSLLSFKRLVAWPC